MVCKYKYQFLLDPYAVVAYCTSYMTKIDKSTTLKLHPIIQQCIANNINVNTKIEKLGNVIFNVQQWLLNLLFT